MQQANYQQLPLRPLGGEALAELLRDLLGTDPSSLPCGPPARTHRRQPVLHREVVQALVEAGRPHRHEGGLSSGSARRGPDDPTDGPAVLAARIDRLPAREKAVLQTAAGDRPRASRAGAAPGRDLPASELAAAVQALVAGEFLYEAALYPEVEYAFKHR